MATQVIMPEMGEGVTEATIIRWLKQVGDPIKEFEGLVEINTDKVDSEVPSPAEGIVLKILHAPDDVIAVNQTLAWIGKEGEIVPDTPPTPSPHVAVKKPLPAENKIASPVPDAPISVEPESLNRGSTPQASWLAGSVSPLAARIAAQHGLNPSLIQGSGHGGQVSKQDVQEYLATGGQNALPQSAQSSPESLSNQNHFISPLVKQLAVEHQIDLRKVKGTGRDQRITKNDMARVIEAGGKDPLGRSQPKPVGVFGGGTPGSLMKINAVRRSIAKHMSESKKISPHVSTFMNIDMSRVSEHRAENKAAFTRQNVNLTYTAYIIQAAVEALQQFPMVNASWTEEGIQLHASIHIGVAVSLEAEGLIVPVIRDAAHKSLLEIARVLNDLSSRARSKTLKAEEVRGGTFTITNHGTSGSIFATPIINQPQTAILGTGLIEKRAVVLDDAIAIRPMLTAGLTFDHRILDGAVGDYFLASIKDRLETW